LLNKEFIFETHGSEVVETYQEGERKYLVSGLAGYNALVGFNLHLICPDNDSDLAHHIKTDPYLNDTFSIPFSDLEFRKSFLKRNA